VPSKRKMNRMLLSFCVVIVAMGQTQDSTPASVPRQSARPGTTAKHDVGSGAGDIGKGAAKGVGSAATATAKGAVDLVTLHPVNAAADVGKGAVDTGRNVGMGAAKGTGKILRGTGKALRHLL